MTDLMNQVFHFAKVAAIGNIANQLQPEEPTGFDIRYFTGENRTLTPREMHKD
jgi:hypothetical protein